MANNGDGPVDLSTSSRATSPQSSSLFSAASMSMIKQEAELIRIEDVPNSESNNNKRSLARNTKRQMDWAVNSYNKWRLHHLKTSGPEERFMINLEDMDAALIDEQIAQFIQEVRQGTGERYSRSSLYNLVDMLSKFLSEHGRPLSIRSEHFPLINQSLQDAVRQSPITANNGASTSGTALSIEPPLFSPSMELQVESALFEKGLLGLDSPQKLFRMLFWFIGVRAGCGGGGALHRDLKFDYFKLVKVDEDECVHITFPPSCIRNAQSSDAPFIVKIRPAEDKTRCPVEAFKLYFSVIPPGYEQVKCFYLRPLKLITNGKKPKWFALQPVGEHTLARVIPELMKEAGYGGLKLTKNAQLKPSNPPGSYLDNDSDNEAEAEISHNNISIMSPIASADHSKFSSTPIGSPKSSKSDSESEPSFELSESSIKYRVFSIGGNEPSPDGEVDLRLLTPPDDTEESADGPSSAKKRKASQQCSILITTSIEIFKKGFTLTIKPND